MCRALGISTLSVVLASLHGDSDGFGEYIDSHGTDDKDSASRSTAMKPEMSNTTRRSCGLVIGVEFGFCNVDRSDFSLQFVHTLELAAYKVQFDPRFLHQIRVCFPALPYAQKSIQLSAEKTRFPGAELGPMGRGDLDCLVHVTVDVVAGGHEDFYQRVVQFGLSLGNDDKYEAAAHKQ